MPGHGRKIALAPLAVFLLVYMGSSVLAGDFYKIPVSAAFLLACIFAVCISKGTLRERIDNFSAGAGNPNILFMIWIFILAGAFSATAKDMGAIDAAVNATLSLVPPRMLLAGMFVTACFISFAIGTSVGTIVALAPIANGIASQCGLSPAFMAAVIVGGALFGDNLSFISDTTIAATRAVSCEMKDKFRVNIYIVLPALFVVTVIYLVKGGDISAAANPGRAEWYKLIPYLLIIVLALLGRDVTFILLLGIIANAVIGFATGAFTWTGWLGSIGGGVAGMSDLIIVTLLAGGLLELIRINGGLDYIIDLLTRRISGKRGAEFSIAALVCLANLCTANNTIAIITSGGIAKDITGRFGLDARKTASILDTFSCMVQGLIPYGAQLLMASALTGCSPAGIIPYLYYPFIMGACAIVSIALRYPRKYS